MSVVRAYFMNHSRYIIIRLIERPGLSFPGPTKSKIHLEEGIYGNLLLGPLP
jgi:hypothetical protein